MDNLLRRAECLACFLVTLAIFVSNPPAQAVTIDTVPIGNPGNPADVRYIDSEHPNGVGSVGERFRIGRNEVTNTQYVEFLKAVAASDPYGLHDPITEGNENSGIVRSGSPGSYSYAVKDPALGGSYTYDDKPVVHVSSGDAMRFANWLHNGQPTGPQDANTTENGAYTLDGAVTDAALSAVTRNAGARWWLPNEDEWYKAAYYDAGAGVYYDYPTGTNSVPNNNLPASDTGNSANFDHGVNGPTITDAGAYALSGSPYGTFDQAGNVWELNESLFENPFIPSTYLYGLRGGAWSTTDVNFLHASHAGHNSPTREFKDLGFRVANIIPEPSTLLLGTMAGLVLLWRRCPAASESRGLFRVNAAQKRTG